MDEQQTTAAEATEKDFDGDLGFGLEDGQDGREDPTAGGEAGEQAGREDGRGVPQQEQARMNTLRVRYNGRDMEVGFEEAPALVQKGLNYDHVKKELESYRTDPGLQALDRMARDAGMSRAEYVSRMPGAPKTLHGESDAEAQRSQYRKFAAAYPDVDVRDIPQEVYRAVAEGETLLGAYRSWENACLRARLAAMQANARAASLAPGSAVGAAPPQMKKDPFDAGFWEN